MRKLQSEFLRGCTEGWQLYWSPLVSLFDTAKRVILGAFK